MSSLPRVGFTRAGLLGRGKGGKDSDPQPNSFRTAHAAHG